MEDMAENRSRWQDLKQRLGEPFRVTVQREETFELVRTYSVNMANLLALGVCAAVLCSLFTFGIVSLSPLRALVPGYGAINEHAALATLNRELSELSEQLDAQRAYADNVRRVLVGDVDSYDRAADEARPQDLDDEAELMVERIAEDEELRAAVAAQHSREQGATDQDLPLDQIDFSAPVAGPVSSAYDPAGRHFGVDVVAPANTQVRAALDGYVVESTWTKETGNVIAVQHAGNLLSFYKHNESLLKRTGDPVKAGEALAIIGNTGTRTDGPHLHFELWHRGRPINPARYVRFE